MDFVARNRAAVLAVCLATAASLGCGTNYAYSAWGPQFADRLELSATQSNTIAAVNNAGLNLFGLAIGYTVDRVGPCVPMLLGALSIGTGYALLRAAYVAGPAPGAGGYSPSSASVFAFMVGIGSAAAFYSAIKVSAVAWPPHQRGTATSFPLAAFGLSALFFTGIANWLSAGDTAKMLLVLAVGTFVLTTVPSLFLPPLPGSGPGAGSTAPAGATRGGRSTPRSGPGSVVSGLRGSSAASTASSVPGSAHRAGPAYAPLAVAEPDDQDWARMSKRADSRTLLLEPNFSSSSFPSSPSPSLSSLCPRREQADRGARVGSGPGRDSDPESGLALPNYSHSHPRPQSDDSEPGDCAPEDGSPHLHHHPSNHPPHGCDRDGRDREHASPHPPRPRTDPHHRHHRHHHHSHTDISGTKLLSDLDFWILFSLLGLLAGTGLMTIYNIGHDVKALWLHHDPSTPTSFLQRTQLTNVAVLSFFSCLGRLISGSGSDYLVSTHRSRFHCLSLSAGFTLLAQLVGYFAAHPRWLTSISGLTGLGYGFVFGVFPAIVSDTFGLVRMSQNWGVVTLGAVVGGSVTNLVYGAVYDANSRPGPGSGSGSDSGSGQGDEGGDVAVATKSSCTLGRECYRNAYLFTTAACVVALGLTAVSVRRERAKKARLAAEAAHRDV